MLNWQKTVFFFIAIGTLLFSDAFGQIQIQDRLVQRDTVQYAFVPAIAYTSDLGLIGGGLVSRFDYSDGFYPYRNLTRMQLLLSTKGMVNFRTIYEHTQTLGTDVRSQWDVRVFRIFDDNYFGIGNNTSFTDELWDERYYNFESRLAGFTYRGRIPVYRGSENRRLDIIAMGNISYTTEVVPEDEISLLNLDQPKGFGGGFVNYPGTGIHWENRDSEFAPTRGNTFRMEAYYSHAVFGSDFNYFNISARGSQYQNIPFLFDTVVAMLLGTEWVSGDTPFWSLPTLGGEERLRGYHLNRFRGDGAVWYAAELRNWIYNNELYEFKVGLHLFTDGGRVFTQNESFTLDGFHTTFGGGASFQLFTPDFILRMEYAKSEDLGRIYMGVGYMF